MHLSLFFSEKIAHFGEIYSRMIFVNNLLKNNELRI